MLTLATVSSCATSPLSSLERTLSANQSATAALEQWCAARRIASPAIVRAIADRDARRPASAAIRASLGVRPDEPLGYRHVQLACGERVLSVAHNWYVPARLTAAMNRTLETGDTPFGKVVAPLGFTRQRLERQRGGSADCPAGTVLADKAVLRVGDGTAISFVVECYTAANLSRD
ncbi:hypothetical protein SAMN06272759_11239 [Novosphingobium sp. B1]|nr:hypothetical protein SAMN06272759_11239 [Novosphingobium sp. B1]